LEQQWYSTRSGYCLQTQWVVAQMMAVATSFNGEWRDWGNEKPLLTIVMWLLNS